MSICRALTSMMPARAMSTKVSKPAASAATAAANKTDQKTMVNHNTGVGFKPDKYSRDVYLNPLLTPPPRSPYSPEDFSNPAKLGHWFPLGFDYTDPVRDKYMFHELLFFFCTGGIICLWLFSYGPDLKDKEWARREAFLRTHKREALGLPLIDPNVVDPDRIVLPTEEELGDYRVTQ